MIILFTSETHSLTRSLVLQQERELEALVVIRMSTPTDLPMQLALAETKGPSSTEWDTHKDEIISLYARHALEEVRVIMEQNYGFKAR